MGAYRHDMISQILEEEPDPLRVKWEYSCVIVSSPGSCSPLTGPWIRDQIRPFDGDIALDS